MSQKTLKDWEGNDITWDEQPSDTITVWEITPHFANKFDYYVVRGYQDAVRCAQDLVATIMDDTSLQHPITISIRTTTMSLSDYQDILDAEL